MPVYRIVDWHKHFECNRTKELKKLSWVPMPNKQDGDGYTELLDHPDGAAHFGCWCAIVQVASKCDPRGTLSRQGAVPHTAATLARITRIPEAILAAAIDRLVRDVRWLEIVPEDYMRQDVTEIPQEDATIPQDDASRACARTRAREWNGMEWNGKTPPPPTPSDPVVVVVTEVHSLGVAEAKRAVESAISNGCELSLVRDLIAHYRTSGGSKPQALYYRLLNLTPGQDVSKGWMPDWKPDPRVAGFVRRQTVDAELERKRDAESAAEAAALEAKFGPAVDAMSDSEVAEIIRDHAFLRERPRSSPMVRQWLIARLAGGAK